MSSWALALTVVLYGYTAVDQAARGNWPLAVMFLCYAGANVALLFVASR